jgi:hypothetical protein
LLYRSAYFSPAEIDSGSDGDQEAANDTDSQTNREIRHISRHDEHR